MVSSLAKCDRDSAGWQPRQRYIKQRVAEPPLVMV
jgi:hypothetical protein